MPGYLGEIFGITLAEDANLCNLPALNGAHPITAGIPEFNLGEYWCADNDGYVLDTADWLFRDGITGSYHGVANEGLARSVLLETTSRACGWTTSSSTSTPWSG